MPVPAGAVGMEAPSKSDDPSPSSSSPGSATPPPLDVPRPSLGGDGVTTADELANELSQISSHVKRVSDDMAKTSGRLRHVRDLNLKRDFEKSVQTAALLRKNGGGGALRRNAGFKEWERHEFPKASKGDIAALNSAEDEAHALKHSARRHAHETGWFRLRVGHIPSLFAAHPYLFLSLSLSAVLMFCGVA